MVWPEKVSCLWSHKDLVSPHRECKMVQSPWKKKQLWRQFPQKAKHQTAMYSFILLLEYNLDTENKAKIYKQILEALITAEER